MTERTPDIILTFEITDDNMEFIVSFQSSTDMPLESKTIRDAFMSAMESLEDKGIFAGERSKPSTVINNGTVH